MSFKRERMEDRDWIRRRKEKADNWEVNSGNEKREKNKKKKTGTNPMTITKVPTRSATQEGR